MSNFESHYSSSAVALPLNPIAVGENLSQMKRAKQSKAHTQAMSQSVVTNMSANINNYSANQIQALSSQYTDHSSSGKNISIITIVISFMIELFGIIVLIYIFSSSICINIFIQLYKLLIISLHYLLSTYFLLIFHFKKIIFFSTFMNRIDWRWRWSRIREWWWWK